MTGWELRLRGVGAADAWRRAQEDRPAPCAFEAIGPEGGFTARYVERRVGEITVADVSGQPLLLRERPDDGGPVILLQAVAEGRLVHRGPEGQSMEVEAGRVLVRRRQPGAVLWSDRPARVVTAFVGQHLLAPRFATAAQLSRPTLIGGDGRSARLLFDLLLGLAEAVPAARAGAIEALGGLLAMELALRPEPPEPVSELAARRAVDALNYLKRNFANPALTPTVMADDLGLSVRYVHKLMGLVGRSFRQELIAQRLHAARTAFAANRRPRETIADIAISVGFNDLSQFNRHFRAAFGMTPRAARKLDEARGYRPEPDRPPAPPAAQDHALALAGAGEG
jgi:AraC-like DNA-binding protein